MRVLMACQNHPDPYNPHWGVFIERSISSIVKRDVEAVALIPRPHVLPMKCVPYNNFSKLPLMDDKGDYVMHYPHYFYYPPKRLFYGLSGDSYSKNITKFCKNFIESPDIIHAHHVFMDGYGMIKIRKEWDVPLVMVEHGAILKEIIHWKIMRKKIIETLNSADHVMCVSEDLVRIAKSIGIDENKVSLVPIGVDINVFKKGDSEAIREELNLKESTKIILYVGQLIPRKGLKYLIEAMPNILSEDKDTLFVFIGKGSQEKELKDLCQRNRIKNILFPGSVDLKSLLKWYSVADIFVLPSLSEGRPTVVYESMACEIAIVATDVGGVAEQIKNGYNGFIVPPKDSKSLSEKISFLLKNDDLRLEMGKNGRKSIVKNGWTWDNHAKNVIGIYKSCL
jgi:teichuronic acid biosynthesis glycosyltransferase TuaC